MAGSLELLFRLKAQNQASPVVRAVQADVAKFTQSAGGQFTGLQQVATKTFGSITASLTNVSSRVPILGTAVNGLSSALSTVAVESTGASAGLAGVAGAAGAVVVAVGAAIAVSIKLGIVLFDLTKRAADFAGKFYDLSQQVGVSVETLSALNNIAENTGGNIDTVTSSLGIFQKHLEAAHDPTSKEAKLLKDLGVTTLDTEAALRQALKGLFAYGEGARQTDAVLQLFGRSGRFVNAILKESGGNIDDAAAAFGPLSQVTLEAARAADEFNDSYNNLTRTIAGAGRSLVSDVIPIFTLLFQDLNKALTGNAEDWSGWADIVKTEIAGVLGTFQGFVLYIATRGNIDLGIAIDQSIQGILERTERLKNKLRFESDVARIQRLTQSVLAGSPGDRPDSTKAATDALARVNRELASAQKAFEESFRSQRAQLERDRDRDIKSTDEWAEESNRIVNERSTAQIKLLDRELEAVRRYVKNKADLALAEEEIQQKRVKLTNETLEAKQRIEDEAQRRRDQAELRLNEQLVAIREAQRAGELEANKRALDTLQITESEALRRQLEILRESFADRQILRDLERDQLSTSAERKIELDNQKIESEQRLTNETKRLIDERIKAITKEAAEGVPKPGKLDSSEIPNVSDLLEAEGVVAPEAEKRFRGLQQAIDDLGASLGDLLGTSEDFGQQFGDVIGSAIDSLAFGIGDLVNQWVLLGSTGPAAMRKLTASVLAGLAAQAAVKAIFQLAEGFAALFFNPAEAAAHFKSAALFAAVAGAAAIAGRQLAGDLFKSQGGAGRNSGGGQGSQGSQQLNPLTLPRNQPQPINVVVVVKPDGSKFGQAITAHILEDGRTAGPIRQFYQDDGSF